MVVVLGSDMMPEKTVNQRSHKRTQLRAYTYRNTSTGAKRNSTQADRKHDHDFISLLPAVVVIRLLEPTSVQAALSIPTTRTC
jgi:hypothetical protein